jgi:hypothetical protein
MGLMTGCDQPLNIAKWIIVSEKALQKPANQKSRNTMEEADKEIASCSSVVAVGKLKFLVCNSAYKRHGRSSTIFFEDERPPACTYPTIRNPNPVSHWRRLAWLKITRTRQAAGTFSSSL